MPGRGRVVLEGIRFAADVASKPSGVLTLWKTATGGKAVGCLPSTPVPELLHAAILLPVALESSEDLSLFSGQIDAWLIGADPSPFPAPSVPTPRFASPRVPPVNVVEALDRIEALAEWAGAVSGSPASEGALWKSIRVYATRRALLDALDERCALETAFLSTEERRNLVRAGIFLPPEAHSRLLSMVLGCDHEPAVLPTEGEKGDPLIVLARRLI
ncbi:MAG TPA: 2-hydroxyacyl-CoA dehydratase family protein [Candidatus Deferrimicrobium sp.]|nr:2-hydroxyacyl-CoA dehydratase family protein [Candidatus Deferrimicrobium sp.]